MSDFSKLVISEPPLQVLPSLAVAVGLNEAIIVQQLHYWLNNSGAGVEHDGHRWIFNTYAEWQKNFPFWSIPTIQRIFASLEKQEVLISCQLGKSALDMTKYYRINYPVLCTMHHIKLISWNISNLNHVPIGTETTCTETTISNTKTNKSRKAKSEVVPVGDFDLLNDEPNPPTKAQMYETKMRSMYLELHLIAGLPEPATFSKRDRTIISTADNKGVSMERLGRAWKHALSTGEARFWPLHSVWDKLALLEYSMENPNQKKVRSNGRLTHEQVRQNSDDAWDSAFGGSLK